MTKNQRNVWTRPRLEYLEDRTLLATLTWIGGQGDAWGNKANWFPATAVPTIADTVIFGPSAKRDALLVDSLNQPLNATVANVYTIAGGEPA